MLAVEGLRTGAQYAPRLSPGGWTVGLRPSIQCEYETRSQLQGLADAFRIERRPVETDPDRITLAWLAERCRRCGKCAAMLLYFAAITPDPQPEDQPLEQAAAAAAECPPATQPLLAS